MYCITTVLRRLSPYLPHDSLEIVLSATARNKAVMQHVKVLSCTANDSLLIFVQLKFWCTTALVGLLVRFPNTQHFVILYFVILPIYCCCCYFIRAERRTRSWFDKERYEYEQVRCTSGEDEPASWQPTQKCHRFIKAVTATASTEQQTRQLVLILFQFIHIHFVANTARVEYRTYGNEGQQNTHRDGHVHYESTVVKRLYIWEACL